jgi:hypothetical protein
MTKAKKSLILNRLVGIPFKVLNDSTNEQIDAFIEKNNLEKYMTLEFLSICEADKQILKWLRTK